MGNISDSVIERNRQSMLFWRKGREWEPQKSTAEASGYFRPV
jgi:hypothetical protein